MGMTLDEGEKKRLRELQTNAEYAEVRLDDAANGYGKGRDDGKSDALRQARDQAKALKEKIGTIIA